ncbi:hypothetical protein I6J17_12425 [Heyndrickxia coagulans]|uniref:hypothetical protein n=1 Tax=Heyndrickxia coagulans TaxID=1398 RepID=UPI0019199932|nr:hypothetical protein [Heyndrickxia coagulans]QQS91737.1 hypothetical protein I6J17_12425 [Heyndrickxia coagulans]UYM83261.1 hypothetical protein OF848_07840 [Heyndrickxia coagulans]
MPANGATGDTFAAAEKSIQLHLPAPGPGFLIIFLGKTDGAIVYNKNDASRWADLQASFEMAGGKPATFQKRRRKKNAKKIGLDLVHRYDCAWIQHERGGKSIWR